MDRLLLSAWGALSHKTRALRNGEPSSIALPRRRSFGGPGGPRFTRRSQCSAQRSGSRIESPPSSRSLWPFMESLRIDRSSADDRSGSAGRETGREGRDGNAAGMVLEGEIDPAVERPELRETIVSRSMTPVPGSAANAMKPSSARRMAPSLTWVVTTHGRTRAAASDGVLEQGQDVHRIEADPQMLAGADAAHLEEAEQVERRERRIRSRGPA